MKLSNLLFQSLREVPAKADIASHQLLLRGGCIRQVAAGIFDFLPLGWRVMRKLETLIREEMDAVGAQEVRLPVVQPAELWQRTGRWSSIGADLARFSDRKGRDLCLGMTHEEVATDLVAQTVKSYRQLPVVIYQLQTKFRDEPRPRGGLIRTREFTMKDAYSFDADEEDFEKTYWKLHDAYLRIFERCGLEVISVQSDTGMMGGSGAHEFMLLTPIGEDTLMLCSSCDYQANRQVATFEKGVAESETPLALEEVATPDTTTIEALTAFLDIPEERTAKAVFLVAELDTGESSFVFAVLRGDRALNETKLSHHVKAKTLRPATAEEIRAVGAEPGYASPIGIQRDKVTLVVDDEVTRSSNLVAGANLTGYHLKNTNYGRDYEADIVADIAAASAGDRCPNCAGTLRAERGVEVGNIFKFGTLYSEALGATFSDESGQLKPLHMGSYGIGVGRLLACIVEKHHDEAGISWTDEVSPFDVHIISLGDTRTPQVARVAEELYQKLEGGGLEPLLDDRVESPGVKFKDADLIGCPWQVTVGRRGLERGVVEVKRRKTREGSEVTLDGLLEFLRNTR